MKAASIRGIAKVVPLFTCSKCSRTSPGDGSVEIQFDGLANLTCRIDILPEPRHYIPAGWSSNGAAGVTCPTCSPA